MSHPYYWFILQLEVCSFLLPSSNSPFSPWTPPLITINLTSFYYEFFCLFLKYNWPTLLYYFLLYNIVIWYFYTFQNNHPLRYYSIYCVFNDYIPYTALFIPVTHLFCTWTFVPRHPPPLFPSTVSPIIIILH